MGSWAAALVAAALATGCNYGAGTFRCTDDSQCGAGGTCELDNLCSKPSSACTSGRAYSDLSGAQSGQCVGGGIPGPGTDSGPGDAPPAIDAGDAAPAIDATACFGSGLVHVCLAAAPTQPLTISALTVIDTDDTTSASRCAALASGGGGACVVAATTITINAELHATGSRPLVVLASDSITVAAGASIDVGSHRTPAIGTPELGAGANPSSCGAGTAPGTSGGGAGGGFTGPGGGGGGPNPGTAASGGAVAELRGGCAGQDGNGASPGAKGNGGGAVFLIAGNMISIAGTINAAGEGGGGGITNTSGAGGGGSGGMIGFDAPVIGATGLILANGGAGGEGSGAGNAGNPGADPTTIMAARGGTGGSNKGGAGGNGSAGAASGPGMPGMTGMTSGGGGGGGGGAGLVNAPAQATLGAQVSPLATP